MQPHWEEEQKRATSVTWVKKSSQVNKGRRHKVKDHVTFLTFPHDIVEEMHNGDSPIGVVVQQLGIDSCREEISEVE